MQSFAQIRILTLSAAVLILPGLLAGGGAWAAPASATSQTSADQAGPESPAAVRGRLLLVLPFENRSNQPNLNWIGDAVPEILNRRLDSAGFLAISRNDRLYALDHLGLPQSFQPSRASAIRLAQTLDANYVVVGSFSVTGTRFEASAQILNVDALHMSPPIEEGADMTHLLDVLNSLAWQLAKHLDPEFAVAQNTFLAADTNVKLAAFEYCVRGLIETDPDGQIRLLKQAVQLDPSYSPALFALGMAYFDNQQYDLAATTLGRLEKNDPEAREADFYRGLAYLYVGSYAKAEDAFAFVRRQLPLPEVVNNEGVAASRRGHDATSLFLQAVAADPSDADYPFNLAIALAHKNDRTGALAAVEKSLKLRPQDTEAQAFEGTLRARTQHVSAKPSSEPTGDAGGEGASDPTGKPGSELGSAAPAENPVTSASAPPTDDSTPLERVKRTFNEASFRQAALELEQLEAVRLSSLPPAEDAAKLTEQGTRFLKEGLLLEAEREFQTALQVDSANAGAHAGLAIVRERDGDAEDARKEAARSLSLEPNVEAYLVLARLDLAADQLTGASENVGHALQLEPENSAARGLRQKLESKGQQTR